MSDDVITTNVLCSCHDHLISLNSWDDGDLFMTIWTPIHTKQWGRFHWAWQSLRGRWSGENEVVLDEHSARALQLALAKHLARPYVKEY